VTVFDTKHQRAAWLVAILGVLIVIALLPYVSGLLGAPVLFVIFGGLHQRLSRLLRHRGLAALVVIAIALISVVLPVVWLVTELVGQAQGALSAVMHSTLFDRLDTLQIGPYHVGPQLKNAGETVVAFVGSSAFALLGKATRVSLNIVFSFFGLYYLLLDPDGAWRALRPHIPFSDQNVEVLKARFEDVTRSTLIGSGLSALLQGVLIALAFMVTGLSNPIFWGAVVAIAAILPVIGSAMVWIPAAMVLFADHQVGGGVGMVIWGAVTGALVDHIFRPFVSSRYAQIHPLLILIGAVAGVSYLGILGLLIGPLALSYFFEVLRMYQREYLEHGPTRSA
jgi:predicted PurR-regulated permease PerM